MEIAEAKDNEADDAEDRAEHEAVVHGIQGFVAGAVRAGLDGVGAPDRSQHADGTDEQAER